MVSNTKQKSVEKAEAFAFHPPVRVHEQAFLGAESGAAACRRSLNVPQGENSSLELRL